MKFRLSARAEADLIDLWAYSAEQWGNDQADRYTDALMERLTWLTENQNLWRERPDIADGLHCYAQQSHVVYFRVHDADWIDVLRVLHARMDPEAHL